MHKPFFFYLNAFVIVFLLSLNSLKSSAQLFSNGAANNGSISTQKIISDSSKKKQFTTDDKVKINYYTLYDTAKKSIDTSIQFLHRNPLQSIWHVDLGNTGSSAFSLCFTPDMNPSMQLGLDAIKPLLFEQKDIKFYNTTRPFTDIYYRNGSKADQLISLLHTQNITPDWNVSVNYRKINSPGFYKWQKTNHDNLALSSQYLSNNKRYSVNAAMLYNKLQQDENGGITSYEYLFSSAYNDKRLIPVNFENISINRSSVSNYYRNVSLLLQQQYFFGKKDSIFNIDSTEKIYNFKPVFSVKHSFYSQHNYYRFKDVQPDTSDYNWLANDFEARDSLFSTNFHTQIGNAFSLNGDVRLKGKVMQAEVGYGIEVEHVKSILLNNQYFNNFIFGRIEKPSQSDREWLYRAHLKLYFTGNTIGNFLMNAQAGRNMGNQLGTFLIGFNQSLQTAPYTFSNYATNYFSTSNSFAKQSISDLFVSYKNVPYKTNLTFHYYLIGNYFYRDTNLTALQYASVIPLFQLQFNKTFQYKTIAFDNQLLIQKTTAFNPIQLPIWASRHRLAYQNKIFKRKLSISTGFDMRYNTPYFASDYAPLYFGFVSQYQYKINNIPEFTYFFNFNVKRFRASIAFDQLQQLFTRNNINFPNYAAQNMALRFGLHWIFVN